jgi:hypothetical protein
MAVEYPDIISEYVVATERYESDGVQIFPYMEPIEIPMGGTATLALLLQSSVDVPVDIAIEAEMPQTSRFRGVPVLEIGQAPLRAKLAPAQVGMLSVPVKTATQAKEGQYEIVLNVAVKAQGQGSRVRPQSNQGRFRSPLIDDVVGLDLARVVGVRFNCKTTRKIGVPVLVRGQAEVPAEAPDLTTRFESLWVVENAKVQGEALHEIGDRRAVIADQLQTEPLFVGLFAEAQRRFAEAGVPLRVGEAIALGKILTYTTRYFLANSDLQDGLLVPIWELALQYELPTGDPLWVLPNVGFRHVLRLSVALSFGLVKQALGRMPWSLEERRGVISLVADTVDAAQPLPVEFLYIPLLMAAATINRQIALENEDVVHSLKLLKKAKAARAEVFADPDLAEAGQMFDQIVKTVPAI